MTLSSPKSVVGLNTIVTPATSNSSGTLSVGPSNESVPLALANTGYTFDALLVGAGTDLDIDLADCDSTGTTAFTTGVAQVETATVVAGSGATSNGNLTLTVTAAGMTGSPKAILVALTTTTHTTATLIAAACAVALNADTAYAALFTATSAGATVITTRKATATYTVGVTSVPTYAANDATLNLAIAAGLGVSAAASSADTTAGVLTAGAYAVDADGEDFEGVTLVAIATDKVGGLLIKNKSASLAAITLTSAATLVDLEVQPSGSFQLTAKNCDQPIEALTIEPVSTALIQVTVLGATS